MNKLWILVVIQLFGCYSASIPLEIHDNFYIWNPVVGERIGSNIDSSSVFEIYCINAKECRVRELDSKGRIKSEVNYKRRVIRIELEDLESGKKKSMKFRGYRRDPL